MKYLVIELEFKFEPKIRLFTKDGEPQVFDNKHDAYRAAEKCNKGLVYPIYDIMKTLEAIKLNVDTGYISYDADSFLTMLDQIV